MVFVFTQSPFILEGTLENHFENDRHEFEETVDRIQKDMFVDDSVNRGNTLDEVRNVKKETPELFQKGVLILFISGIPMCQLWRAIT